MTGPEPILFVDDIQAALDTFVDDMGWKEEATVPGPDGKPVHSRISYQDNYIQFGNTEVLTKDRWKKAHAEKTFGVGVELYTKITDVDSYFDRIRSSSGVTVHAEPQTQFWGDRIFSVEVHGFYLTFYENVKQVSVDEMADAVKAEVEKGS